MELLNAFCGDIRETNFNCRLSLESFASLKISPSNIRGGTVSVLTGAQALVNITSFLLNCTHDNSAFEINRA